MTRLSRRALDDPARAPERIVHLGLGAFHRAHQAWYTAHAADAADWGIVAFTGRSGELAEQLTAQQGVYTLVERGPDEDRFERIGSIVRAVPGDDVAEFVRVVARPETAILTLTITEAGYRLGADGAVDLADAATLADLDALRTGAATPTTALGRILLGLDARRRAGAPPLAIVPCDNLPRNGEVMRRALVALAERANPELAAWLPTGVSIVSTSVDRITPRAPDDEPDRVEAATGFRDDVPVVTEPFSDWVLSGDFPSGRPQWETAGARFVDDLEPWELRKLWLLNGAHTLLAAAGRLRGHATVAEAIADPECLAAVTALWDEDVRHLPELGLTAYRAALLERFRNPRIVHRLEQIAQDGLTKLRVRIVPVALAERAAGRDALGCAAAIGAWIASVEQGLAPGETAASLQRVDPALAADPDFARAVRAAADTHAPSKEKP